MTSPASLDLFVSHSSVDSDLVEPLVDLLQSALDLEPDRIRATSVEGYRLPAGIRFEEALRRETHDARAFIGVISSASLDSVYVAFELGSRWGAGRHLIPLLTRDIPPSTLTGPLANLNAMKIYERPDVQQLIDDLAKELGIRPRPPHQYSNKLERLLAATTQGPQPMQPRERGTRPTPDLGGDAVGVDYAGLVEGCDLLMTLREQVTRDSSPAVYEKVESAERQVSDWIRANRLVANSEIARDADLLLGMLREELQARRNGFGVKFAESPRDVFARLVERARSELRRP
jgi:hypothetical protein